MDIYDIIFAASSGLNSVRRFVTVPPPVDDLSKIANDEMDVLAPVDPGTGKRPNLLSKIVDPRVSPAERDRIAAALQRVPSSPRSGMSDEDLIATAPSRYNTTFVDSAAYADHLSGIVDADSSAASSDGDTPPSPDSGADSSASASSSES
jgi:hypothetical protein